MYRDRLSKKIKGWKQSYYSGKILEVDIQEIGKLEYTFWDKSGEGEVMLNGIDITYEHIKPYMKTHMPSAGGVMRLPLGRGCEYTIEVSELALLQYPDGTRFMFWDELSESQNEFIIISREPTRDGGFIFNIRHNIASEMINGTSSYKIKIMDSICPMDKLFDDMELNTQQLLDLKVGDTIYITPDQNNYLGNPDPHYSTLIYKDIEVMVTKHSYFGDTFYDIYFLNYGYNTVILPK